MASQPTSEGGKPVPADLQALSIVGREYTYDEKKTNWFYYFDLDKEDMDREPHRTDIANARIFAIKPYEPVLHGLNNIPPDDARACVEIPVETSWKDLRETFIAQREAKEIKAQRSGTRPTGRSPHDFWMFVSKHIEIYKSFEAAVNAHLVHLLTRVTGGQLAIDQNALSHNFGAVMKYCHLDGRVRVTLDGNEWYLHFQGGLAVPGYNKDNAGGRWKDYFCKDTIPLRLSAIYLCPADSCPFMRTFYG